MLRYSEFQIFGKHQARQVKRNLPPVNTADHNKIKLSVFNISFRTYGDATADETAVRHRTDKILSFLFFSVSGYLQMNALIMKDCFDQSKEIRCEPPVLFLFILRIIQDCNIKSRTADIQEKAVV